MTKFIKLKEAKDEEYFDYYGDENSPKASERAPVKNKTPVLGSMDLVTDAGHDAGLLSTVHEAYSYHYNLRTGPEDWWFTIAQTVALAIDENSKSNEIRQFFVQHEGKKKLIVRVGAGDLKVNSVDYAWLFDQFTKRVEENINVPEYVQQMIPDFSTTTIVHRIVAQVTMMASVQEFFEYNAPKFCGIPAIEMKGTVEDWANLVVKIKALRKTLSPIEDVIGKRKWWDNVEVIAEKLLDTFKGNPDEDWWARIISNDRHASGESHFNGWFMNELLNKKDAATIGNAPSGLVSIPIKFSDRRPRIETGAVIAGMVGYKFHEATNNTLPAVEPMHGWSLLLKPNSVFRKDLSDWELGIRTSSDLDYSGIPENDYEDEPKKVVTTFGAINFG